MVGFIFVAPRCLAGCFYDGSIELLLRFENQEQETGDRRQESGNKRL